MIRIFIISLFLLPCLVSAQATKEDYAIYSQYLQHVKTYLKGQADFVVRESTDYGRKDEADFTNVVTNLREFVKGDYSSLFDYHCDTIVPILQKDTAWIGLVSLLNQKIKTRYVLKNEFATGLKLSVISNHDYVGYFGNGKHLGANWRRFHKKYPIPAYLIDLSEIVKDNNHAVFYFSRRWDGIGNGWLVLFYKDGSEWKFLQALHIWDA